MRVVIFLGPSLSVDVARSALDATYLPPAKQGDLLSAVVNERPDIIGLIDGVFDQSLSVWHKEILYALDRGVEVFGASSMGALRAAETDVFGMVGVGQIYEQYASGQLLDDDEVALLHGPQETGYRKLSEPMVNVRATFQAAAEAGVIDNELRSRLNGIAKQLHYTERRFSSIYERAIAVGAEAEVIGRLAEFVSTSYVDLKARDALRLLEMIRDSRTSSPSPRPMFTFSRTSHFDTLYNRDRLVKHGSISTPLEAIGNYVSLHHPGFDDLNFNALNRVLVVNWAHILDIDVSDEDVESESSRFRDKWELDTDDDLATWLSENDLDAEEFRALMRETALCRRLQRWLIIARWMDRSTKPILDELRLRNEYVAWARRAASHERLLGSGDTVNDAVPGGHHTLEELIEDHREWTDVQIPENVSQWAEEAGFHSEAHLKMELQRAKVARNTMLRLVSQATLTDEEPESDTSTE